MGEFGFITADGVYHVTVYATDENGNFKILSMKNIRVKPYPVWNPRNNTARQGHSLTLPSAPQAPHSQPLSTTAAPRDQFKPISIEPPVNSCSHCSVPTTSTRPPPPAVSSYNNQPNNNYNNPQFGTPQYINSQHPGAQQVSNSQSFNAPKPIDRNTASAPSFPSQQNNVNSQFNQQNSGVGQQQISNNPQNYPNQELIAPLGPSAAYPQQNSGNAPNHNGINSPQAGYNAQQGSDAPQNYPGIQNITPQQGGVGPQYPGAQGFPQTSGPNLSSAPGVGDRTPKVLSDVSAPFSLSNPQQQYNSQSNAQNKPAVPTKPMLISAQMQIVDKNTDIHHKKPGEKDGLPNGVTKDHVKQLLYTFNYTLGFQGHFEEGYSNGDKQGYYFVTGRNGVRTRVDYVADSNGFRPKITQDVLDLLSDDVPKPETEKEAKYGLKGYEFKWIYYPVESISA